MTNATNDRSHLLLVDLISIGTLVGTFAITAALYARLPEIVPIHFDIHGRADGFAPRAIGAWFLPLFAVLVAAFIRFSPRILGAKWRERLEGSPTAGMTLVLSIMLCALHLVMMRLAIAPETDAAPMLAAVLGVTWVALGQLMPRTRRNPIMGVRTRWTLASDENWARTHRIAGIAFTVGGAIAIVGAAVSSMAVAVIAILLSGLYPLLWMRRHAKNSA
jgi:uncharacterized membrane protein